MAVLCGCEIKVLAVEPCSTILQRLRRQISLDCYTIPPATQATIKGSFRARVKVRGAWLLDKYSSSEYTRLGFPLNTGTIRYWANPLTVMSHLVGRLPIQKKLRRRQTSKTLLLIFTEGSHTVVFFENMYFYCTYIKTKILSMLGTGYFLKIAKINSQQEKPICPNHKN